MIIEARDDVVTLSGSLETNQWPAIQAPANLLLRIHSNGILIDAGQITHCSDEGARTFLDGMEYIERHRARIVLCRPPQALLETLKHVPGLRSQLPIADTCDQGRASLELASDTRRRNKAKLKAGGENAGAIRPRLIMAPLIDEGGRADGLEVLKGTLGLALQIGMRQRGVSTQDADMDGGTDKKRRIAPSVHFLVVLEVPRSMPINSPMTDEESRAKIAIEEAAGLADSVGLVSQTSVARARDVGEEIAEQATMLSVDIIILTLPPIGAPNRDHMQAIVDSVLQRARCQVVVKNWPS